MIIHEYQKRVRYGETDQMGYLYYGNYAAYYEIGRVEMLRAYGLVYRELEEKYGVMMPVVSMEMRFVRPALYDELLTIRTTLSELPDHFVTFQVDILNERAKLVNRGKARLCFFDIHAKKTIPAPEIILEKLKPHFEETENTES